jgi:hypothetical protein
MTARRLEVNTSRVHPHLSFSFQGLPVQFIFSQQIQIIKGILPEKIRHPAPFSAPDKGDRKIIPCAIHP